MPGPLSIGDVAPNFDLSSTEDAVLMLKDEVVRTALVVYFFADPASERVQRDLDALSRWQEPLRKLDLKRLQVQRKLLFPLLHDDRNFSAAYGVAAAEEGQPAAPALVVVGRRQEVKWLANPVTSAEDAMAQVEKLLKDLPSPTRSYPKSVINRLIDGWVN